MINKLKEYFAKLKVQKMERSLPSKVYNYHNSNLIGVVASLESETQYNLIIRYVQKLKESYGIRRVICLFYCDAKELPEYFKETNFVSGITKLDFSYTGISDHKGFKEFLNEKFNILLDFSRNVNTEDEFIVKSSKASFKVGKFAAENQDLYDFMIDLDGSRDLSKFMDSLDRYLVMIDNKK